jgi:hypothetical protein
MKKTFQFYAFLGLWSFTGMNSNAQLPEWQWAKSAGSSSYDYARSVVLDSAGNSYVSGYFNTGITFGNDSYLSNGSSDIYIVKYDRDGNVLWSESAGGTDNDQANSIAVDRYGNSYVAGFFKSSTLVFGSYTLTNAGGNSNDIFVVKYDSEGNVVWAVSTGSTKDDRAVGIAVDTLGNCYVTGWFTSTSLTFGSTTCTNSGGLDVFIVKYDPEGSVIWATSATGTGADYVTSIALDKSSNIYITGYFNSGSLTFGSTVLTKKGNNDMFIVKYKTNGSLKWAKNAGINNDNTGNAIAVDTSGNSYVAGSFKGSTIVFGSTTLTNSGHADIFIVKYDSLGSPVWAKSSGGTLEDAVNAVSTDKFGYCYVAGFFKSTEISFESYTLTNAGSQTSDIFLLEYSPVGDVVWARSAGGTGDDVPISMTTDTLRNFYIAGYFGSKTMVFDTTTLTNAGTTDMFIAKSNNTVITGLKDINQSVSVTLFPNPVKDYLTITAPHNSIIEIYNINGQAVKTVNYNREEVNINLTGLPGGIYILKVTSDKGTAAKKFIKQ